MKRKVLFPSLLLILVMILPRYSWAWSGKVVGIADGDTITVLRDKQQVKIRLYGIDTPERRQASGTKAKQFTSEMAFGKVVEVEPVDIDRYNRLVALVTVFERLVNEELVNAGFAWVYTRYCDRPICERWKVLEHEARKSKRGLMCPEAEKRFHFFLLVRWIASRGGGRLCIPFMHTVLDFNLAQNAVGGQVNAVKKVTPIKPGADG